MCIRCDEREKELLSQLQQWDRAMEYADGVFRETVSSWYPRYFVDEYGTRVYDEPIEV